MKKFISVIPLQNSQNLHKVKYNSLDNNSLDSNIETRFPILVAIDKSVQKGDKISVVCILTDYKMVGENYKLFTEELSQLAEGKGFEYDITEISTEYNENINVHLKLFGNLIENIKAEDTISACITYGTKPTPMIISMALNYAKNSVEKTDIDKIIYGRFDHETKKSYIHDVSALFYMNSVVEKIGNSQMKNPLATIKAMLEM